MFPYKAYISPYKAVDCKKRKKRVITEVNLFMIPSNSLRDISYIRCWMMENSST